MPFLDGTGPRGTGPMTGRGAGYCTGYTPTGFARPFTGTGRFFFNRGTGRGIGRCRGRGIGRRWFGSYTPYSRW